ncbi:hypothetical protein E4U60_007564 [Claviceps pazoutovae]|uniref:Major facilitator superfamily (MFS) profile domain-containing protein n=1 Tax=Claviceps pazoutovae TaxID=1649127 RepID=A0A9P7M3L6_9HYPO|nr:hypothetical protein E4U60_007564 [Claviceps pazoutovae]
MSAMGKPEHDSATASDLEHRATESSLEKQDVEAAPPGPVKPVDPSPKQSNLKTTLLLASVFLAMFLVAVDRTIISTAIPSITNDFNSLNDVGWYGSIYLLTCCAFQLLFGKLYAMYSARVVLLVSLVIFLAASALCGAAPNSEAFIVGRAISGVGSAGIFAGNIIAIVHTIPLAKRPKIQGLMGAVMGLATIIGPLIGGAFTTKVTWRWCFYINLPFGGVAMVAIFFYFKVPNRSPAADLPLKQKILSLDIPGTFLLVPAIVCLLLALQWGGQVYDWNNKYIIVLLTLMAVLFVAFIAVQICLPKTATVPPRLLMHRSVVAGFLTTIAIGSAQYIFVYYIPIWFQTVRGVNAVDSGIQLLPLMISFVVASIVGGLVNQRIGYYTALGIFGSSVMAVGAGLMTTWHLDISQGKVIGYQILFGFGMGLAFQTPNLAVQTVLPRPEVPMGIALMFFGQLLSAAIFVAVGQNILANQLLSRLAGIDGFEHLKSLILSGGVTAVIDAVPAESKHRVLVAYSDALQQVFIVGLAMSCVGVVGTSCMEWKNILKKPAPPAGPPAAAPTEGAPTESKAAGHT